MKIGKLEVYGVIYKITNKVNNKVYIGQTIEQGGFDRRYRHNIEKNTHNNHLKYAIKKYNIENFEIAKTFDVAFSKEELDIKETFWISYFKSMNKECGYNKRDGGSHGKLSEETKLKISKGNKGKIVSVETRNKMRQSGKIKIFSEEHRRNIGKANTGEKHAGYKGCIMIHCDFCGSEMYRLESDVRVNKNTFCSRGCMAKWKSKNCSGENSPIYGIKRSEDFKIKQSNIRKGTMVGKNNPFYGKHHSEKAKENISKANKGRKCTEAAREKMSSQRQGKDNPRATIVEVYNKQNILLQVFKTISECAQWLVEINCSNLVGGAKNSINNSIKTDKAYKGFLFKKYTKQEYKNRNK